MNINKRRQLGVARSYAHDLTDEISAILALHWNGVDDGFAHKNAEERAIDNLHGIAQAMGFRLVAIEAVAPVQLQAAE